MGAQLPGLQPWKLAGFVGMHTDNEQTMRDQRDFWLASKFGGNGEDEQQQQPVAVASTGNNNNINNSIIRNTPHEFIRGGYKEISATWEGRRIDEFAAFLASTGITRGEPGTTSPLPLLHSQPNQRRAPSKPPAPSPMTARNKR